MKCCVVVIILPDRFRSLQTVSMDPLQNYIFYFLKFEDQTSGTLVRAEVAISVPLWASGASGGSGGFLISGFEDTEYNNN